jgi:hypothetical protein
MIVAVIIWLCVLCLIVYHSENNNPVISQSPIVDIRQNTTPQLSYSRLLRDATQRNTKAQSQTSLGFHNCVLIVVFNYSDCLNNLLFIKGLYQQHFKHIIFYSDLPVQEDHTEVHFMDIQKGYFTHRVFYHFYENYSFLLEDCDGLFYTMDDNIINLQITNLLPNDRIFYSHGTLHTLDHYNGWWWDKPQGKESLYNLLQDADFRVYDITTFTGAFSDWFYVPRRYLTKELFVLFSLFGRYNVFLEIAIPTVLGHAESDPDQYGMFSEMVLWGDDRRKVFEESYLHRCFKQDHHLILHPIKFNENPSSQTWLQNLFQRDKCVIITTINTPTAAILKHIDNEDYDTIIVGDRKTPLDPYHTLRCILLDVQVQEKLFPVLSNIIPYNHYGRKNLGYLYAIKKGYKIIYETDDDNIPHMNFDDILYRNPTEPIDMIEETGHLWINIFKYFTEHAHIWPRGLPLSLIKRESSFRLQPTDEQPSIINGLVENDADVDACFRLVCKHQNDIQWRTKTPVLIHANNVCVFNTQNTFWLNPNVLVGMLIPCSVSFRYCDILRGLIANIVLKYTSAYMMYTSPNVTQNRNEHNLIQDFKSEIEMYLHNETLMEDITLEKVLGNAENTLQLLQNIYKVLEEKQVIKSSDRALLNVWLSYF